MIKALDMIKAEVARGRLVVLEVVADEVGFVHLSYQEYLAGDAMRLLVQSGGDVLAAASGGGALGGLGAWLGTCAGEVWWSQALLMGLEGLAYDKGAEAAALDALGADTPATAALRVGGEAELAYKPRGTHFGRAYRVRIEALGSKDGRAAVRRVGSWLKRAERVPASLLTLRAAGPGVLALAAARAGATRVVGGLVARGVHLGVADVEHRNTLLHAALQGKHEATALALIDAGAVDDARAANAQNVTPGGAAVLQGLHAVHRALSPSPGDVEVTHGGMLAPLLQAARNSDHAAVERLLAQGADVNVRSKRERCTALSLIAENGDAALVPVLAAARADVNAASGTTPDVYGGAGFPCIVLAAYYGHTATVAALLASRADADRADSRGRTALFLAAGFGDLATAEVLLEGGAA
eukprot:7040591-Prymnesium_polylepis.1